MSADSTGEFPKGYDVSEGVIWIPGGNTIAIRNVTRVQVWKHLNHPAIITCIFASPFILSLGVLMHWSIPVVLLIALLIAAIFVRKTSLKIFLSDSTYHKASFWSSPEVDRRVHNLREKALSQLK